MSSVCSKLTPFERRKRLIATLNKSPNLQSTKNIHGAAIECRDDLHIHVASTLIKMYSRFRSMQDARCAFDKLKRPDVVCWNALLFGYVENGESRIALKLFSRMRFDGYVPDGGTFNAALRACSELAENELVNTSERGKAIHMLASSSEFELQIYAQSTLIGLYSKCGVMNDAQKVFDGIKHPDVVCWTTLMLGYAETGEGGIALDLFARMKREGCVPDAFAFSAVLKACASLGALELGRHFHAQLDKLGFHCKVLATCLVDLYAKCGSLVEAEGVFTSHIATSDLVAWNALIGGYSCHGDVRSVLNLFTKMKETDLRPDATTFMCVLAACSHAGLLEAGKKHFENMHTKYGIHPNAEHYNCMISMLGRANMLDDAMALLRSMTCAQNVITWMAILAACRKFKILKLAVLTFQSLMSLDNTNAKAHLLIAHIYGSLGLWTEQARMKARGLGLDSKTAKSSWTSPGGAVHTFEK